MMGAQVLLSDNPSIVTVYTEYQSYLLRLWQETPHAPWRASLQNAATGERRGFSDLESLFTFLRTQIDP
jgi:hypothetical protein